MSRESSNFFKGMAFLSPWVIGFVFFLVVPIILSFYYSLCDYRMLQPPAFDPSHNYLELWHDAVFWKVIKNTFLYALMALPAGLFVSLGLAMLLNVTVPGQPMFRTIIFLPSLTPAAASAFVWMFLLNARLGLVNNMLQQIGYGIWFLLALALLCAVIMNFFALMTGKKPTTASIVALVVLGLAVLVGVILEFTGSTHAISGMKVEGPIWFDVDWVLKTLALMSVWGVGNTVVIYLAGLQDVPRELYEAASIDGANTLRRLWHVTLPMLSPVIFFNLIMAIIGTLQNFTIPQLITQGGPDNASKFLSMYLYDFAFTQMRMGYASAMAWVQLLLVLIFTGLAFWSQRHWVHYQGK